VSFVSRHGPGFSDLYLWPDYTFHCYARTEGLAAVIISKNYPQLTAHSILSKILDEFLTDDRRTPDQKRNPKDNDATFAALKDYLQRYQDPAQASSITAIQQQLDETKIILHKTIDSVGFMAPIQPGASIMLSDTDTPQVLQRGEKIDDLVAKSSDLSTQSKAFYTTAKKQNSCCSLM
jgi:synaptobrevin homolog YKT6